MQSLAQKLESAADGAVKAVCDEIRAQCMKDDHRGILELVELAFTSPAQDRILEVIVDLVHDNELAQAQLRIDNRGLRLALDALDRNSNEISENVNVRQQKLALELISIQIDFIVQHDGASGPEGMYMKCEVTKMLLQFLRRNGQTEEYESHVILKFCLNMLEWMMAIRVIKKTDIIDKDGFDIFLQLFLCEKTLPEKLRETLNNIFRDLLSTFSTLPSVSHDDVYRLKTIIDDDQVSMSSLQLALYIIRRIAESTEMQGIMLRYGIVVTVFQMLARSEKEHLTKMGADACYLLVLISTYAIESKLDMTEFISPGICRGEVLVTAAKACSDDAKTVIYVYRFFATACQNVSELPSLIDSTTMKRLLHLYHELTHKNDMNMAIVKDDLIIIIKSLSRSCITSLGVLSRTITMETLYDLCHYRRSEPWLISQVFAMINAQPDSVIDTEPSRDFCKIAVDVIGNISLTSDALTTEMAELYFYLYRTLHTKRCLQNGDRQRLSSAIKQALTTIHGTKMEKRSTSYTNESASTVATIAMCVQSRLNPPQVKTTPKLKVKFGSCLFGREMDNVNELYRAHVRQLLQKEGSCPIRDQSHDDETYGVSVSTELQQNKLYQSDDRIAIVAERDGENERNDNQTNLKNEETSAAMSQDIPNDEGAVALEASSSNEDQNDVDGDEAENGSIHGNDDSGDSECEDAERDDESPCAPILDEHEEDTLLNNADQTDRLLNTQDDIKADEMEYKANCYFDASGTCYPRHPYNDRPKLTLLKPDSPCCLESCNSQSRSDMSDYIETAQQLRAEFNRRDPHYRARVVYTAKKKKFAQQSTEKSYHNKLEHPIPYDIPSTSQAFEDSNTPSLTFDSDFESGNLASAIRIGDQEYDLLLRSDGNAWGSMQWFYFGISNVKLPRENARMTYTFNIINLCKPDSLFNHGLLPLVYSVKNASEENIGWLRQGKNVAYFANPYLRSIHRAKNPTAEGTNDTSNVSKATFYTLTFTLTFENEEDTYLVAHSYPYTLTDHAFHMRHLLKVTPPNIIKRSELCRTIDGKQCELVTISDFDAKTKLEWRERKTIMLTARVHPGETQASWIMRGILDFLTGNSLLARTLRRLFVFRIIPMLNPDGVYYGHSRCALSCVDLNRHWHQPSEVDHPTIYYAKKLLEKECNQRGVLLFCDVHGHSRKRNMFLYGCDPKRRPNPLAKLFAKLFAAQPNAKDFLSYTDCSFTISKDKKTTARVVVFDEFNVSWSFTMESSFCGPSVGERRDTHFNTLHLQQAGAALCEAIFVIAVKDVRLRQRLLDGVEDFRSNFPLLLVPQLRDLGIIFRLQKQDSNEAQTTCPSDKPSKRVQSDRSRRSDFQLNVEAQLPQHHNVGSLTNFEKVDQTDEGAIIAIEASDSKLDNELDGKQPRPISWDATQNSRREGYLPSTWGCRKLRESKIKANTVYPPSSGSLQFKQGSLPSLGSDVHDLLGPSTINRIIQAKDRSRLSLPDAKGEDGEALIRELKSLGAHEVRNGVLKRSTAKPSYIETEMSSFSFEKLGDTPCVLPPTVNINNPSAITATKQKVAGYRPSGRHSMSDIPLSRRNVLVRKNQQDSFGRSLIYEKNLLISSSIPSPRDVNQSKPGLCQSPNRKVSPTILSLSTGTITPPQASPRASYRFCGQR